MNCKHEKFSSHCNVIRLDDPFHPLEFRIEVKVACVNCTTSFRFIGLPIGYNPRIPTISADGKELRAPIEETEKEMICRCGHSHSQHEEILSVNYTAGKCSQCSCSGFVIRDCHLYEN